MSMEPQSPHLPDQIEYRERRSRHHHALGSIGASHGVEGLGSGSGQRHSLRNGRTSRRAQGNVNAPQATNTGPYYATIQAALDASRENLMTHLRAFERGIPLHELDSRQRRILQIPEPFSSAFRETATYRRSQDQILAMQREVGRLLDQLEHLISQLEEQGTRTSNRSRVLSRTMQLRETVGDFRFRLNEMLLAQREPSSTGSSDLLMRSWNPSGELDAIYQRRYDDHRAEVDQALGRRERNADRLEASEGEVQAARESMRALTRYLERDGRSVDSSGHVFRLRDRTEQQGADHEHPIAGTLNDGLDGYIAVLSEERNRDQVIRNDSEAQIRHRLGSEPLGGLPDMDGSPDLSTREDYNTMINAAEAMNHAQPSSRPLVIRPPSPRLTIPNRYAREHNLALQDSSEEFGVMDLRGHTPDAGDRRGRLDALERRYRRTRLARSTMSAHVNEVLNRLGANHTDESVDYPAFTGQIEAIESTNQRLRHQLHRDRVRNEENFAYLPHVAAGLRMMDSTDEEDDGNTVLGEGGGLDDEDDGRPAPKDENDMTVVMGCKICLEQVADIACLPCGHLAMCQWCAEKYIPSQAKDKTRPLGVSKCPLCRAKVKQKVKIFAG